MSDSDSAWDEVVRAERAYGESLAAFALQDLPQVVGPALQRFDERPTALSVLRDCDPRLTKEVFPQLTRLLLVSHSLLEECRRLVLRIEPADLAILLDDLVQQVVCDPEADYEAFRRLAELLTRAGCSSALAELVKYAASAPDQDIREVATDFADDGT